MKSLIYGYGITGKYFERYLIKNNISYDIFDENIPKFSKINPIEKYETIYCSPGIPKNIFQELKSASKVLTDIDIFFKEDSSIKIGITGTNRKSTTCFHLYQIISQNHSAGLVGNIGEPVLDSINKNDYSVIELSSFQLDKMISNKLDFGILLNIASDHLDYHGTYEAYIEAKNKIKSSKNYISEQDPYKIYEWIFGEKSLPIDLEDLPYRFQKITDSIINDSKSTNSDSLLYALKQAKKFYKGNEYTLILCGNPAKEGYKKLDINGPKEVLIYGLHRNEIDECIYHEHKMLFDNLKDLIAYLISQNQKNILFSPGYPSTTEYKNFEDRGEHFNKCIQRIIY